MGRQFFQYGSRFSTHILSAADMRATRASERRLHFHAIRFTGLAAARRRAGMPAGERSSLSARSKRRVARAELYSSSHRMLTIYYTGDIGHLIYFAYGRRRSGRSRVDCRSSATAALNKLITYTMFHAAWNHAFSRQPAAYSLDAP